MFAGILGQDLDPPALPFGIARIHTEQVAGKDRRLVAAGAGTNFQEDVAAVLGVPGQQHALQAPLDFFQLAAGLLDLLLSHLAHIRIAVLEQRLGAFEVGLQLEEIAVCNDDRLDLGIFARIGAEAGLVADHLGIAEQRRQLFEAVLQDVEFVEQRRFHDLSVWPGKAKIS